MDSKMEQIMAVKKELDFLKHEHELARLVIEGLKKENERLKLKTDDLWNLLANEAFDPEEQYIIEALIEGNGEEYVKRVLKSNINICFCLKCAKPLLIRTQLIV